jgi:SagB-type dehydrogenase family enzyme
MKTVPSGKISGAGLSRTKVNWLFFLIFFIAFPACNSRSSENSPGGSDLTRIDGPQLTYILPAPKTDGVVSVENALANRRSHRSFQNRAISAEQLSQILWAAYGITSPMPNQPGLRGGLRTSPSAGALYPLEIYVIAGNVQGIEAGVYRYISGEHKIVRTISGDLRDELTEAALRQGMIREAPVTVFYSAVFSRMTGRYGDRGRLYAYIELGHSAQNVYLQAEALGLGTCAIGAFVDSRVRQVLQLPAEEEPLYLMPIGYIR